MCVLQKHKEPPSELQPNGDKGATSDHDGVCFSSKRRAATYSEDEADGGHARGGHHFGTVGDQVEEDGHGGLGRVVEATAEH